MIRVLVILVALFCPVSGTLDGGELSPIPTDSWQYRELQWILLNPPEVHTFQITARPYLRADVLELLGRMHVDSNTVQDQKRIKLLSDHRVKTLYESGSESNLTIRNKLSCYNITHFADTMDPLYRTGIKEEIALSYGDKVTLFVRGLLENKGYRDPQFKGRVWKGKLTGYFDYGLLTIRHGCLTFQYGRSPRIWGAGDFDRLLISNNSPSFDQIAAQFSYKRLMFQTWLTRLDDYNEPVAVRRYLSGHRLSFKPRYNLEIGLSETALHGREAGPDWVYLNPFLPYYWEQYNIGEDDNIYMGADFVWWPFEATRMYGEFLIDDFQIDFVSELHQIGLDVGMSRLGFFKLDRLGLDLQYTFVNNYVYGQRLPHNIFTNEGVIIGSSLGPDSDRFRCSARYAVTADITLSVGGTYRRRGEGRVTDRQDVTLPRHEKFPSGTVEKTWTVHFHVSLLSGSALDMQAEAGFYRIDNYMNKPGSIDSPYLRIKIQRDFQTWLKL